MPAPSGSPPVCAVSVDVDPIPCYYRIHGLDARRAPAELRDVVARRALPRFAELFSRRGIAATFFVVAEDIDAGALGPRARATRARYAELVAAGHELASHSYSHPYDLARWPVPRMRDEITRAHELLGAMIGRVHGFRAPGYDVSPAMIDELLRLGYVYDSSIFPAPGYYAAKAAVMACQRVRGRRSGAVLTNPRALAAPASPYRPSPRSPWRRGRAEIIELPVAVTPRLRAPVIGTSLLLAPDWLRRRLVGAMAARGFFNLELHGIDLIDAEEDGIPGELVSRQPDLRLPVVRKLAALDAVLDQVQGRYRVGRLADLAERWAGTL